MLRAHFRFYFAALLVLMLTVAVSSETPGFVPLGSSLPQSQPFIVSTTENNSTQHHNASVNARPLKLSTTQYSWKEIALEHASRSKVSLIVAIQDYGPRSFSELVKRLTALQEQCQKSINLELEIFFTHFGDTELLQFDIIDQSAQLFNEQIKFIAPSSPKAQLSLGQAYNNAAEKASGSVLIFTTDTLQDLSAASVMGMVRVLKNSDIGIVAPKIVDGQTGGTTVFSTGISFVLGKNPHKSAWSSWYVSLNPFVCIFIRYGPTEAVY